MSFGAPSSSRIELNWIITKAVLRACLNFYCGRAPTIGIKGKKILHILQYGRQLKQVLRSLSKLVPSSNEMPFIHNRNIPLNRALLLNKLTISMFKADSISLPSIFMLILYGGSDS